MGILEGLLGLLATVGGLLAFWFKTKADKIHAELDKADREIESAKKVIDHVEIKNRIKRDNDVNVKSSSDRLREKWLRD